MALVGIILAFFFIVVYFAHHYRTNPIQIPIPLPSSSISGLPMRLRIPVISVDAIVEHVGLIPDGSMDIPKNPNNVAWFSFGKIPGENGSAVIDGHYGIKDGKGSVFDTLYKVRKGDLIYVENDKGVIVSFAVHEIRNYESGADAASVFASSDGKSHLNLITCEGVWDDSQKSYSQRLVVFADKE